MSFIDQTIGHMREILMINQSIVYVTSLNTKKRLAKASLFQSLSGDIRFFCKVFGLVRRSCYLQYRQLRCKGNLQLSIQPKLLDQVHHKQVLRIF